MSYRVNWFDLHKHIGQMLDKGEKKGGKSEEKTFRERTLKRKKLEIYGHYCFRFERIMATRCCIVKLK